MSPNYPQNYHDNLLCVWTVSVPSGDINLLISDMAIADGDVGCPSDGLFVCFLHFANRTKWFRRRICVFKISHNEIHI